jgi:hypothetical protein
MTNPAGSFTPEASPHFVKGEQNINDAWKQWKSGNIDPAKRYYETAEKALAKCTKYVEMTHKIHVRSRNTGSESAYSAAKSAIDLSNKKLTFVDSCLKKNLYHYKEILSAATEGKCRKIKKCP